MSAIEQASMIYADAIEMLARWHADDQDPPITVYSFDDPDEQEVRLLEVSEAFVTSEEVWPVTFRATDQLPYMSTVILVSAEEYDGLETGEFALPEGWPPLNEGRRVWPR